MTRGSQTAASGKDVDSGWAWVVLLASFLTFVICVGIGFSSGIYYNYFKEAFQCGNEVTAWIFSIYSGFSKILAVFCGFAIRKFGHRTIIMVGSLISAIGFIATVFATNIYQVFFTYSILAGSGLGFITVPASTIIADYFVQKRDFALPIPLIGISFGMFIFPPLTQWLIDNYGWKQSFLIQSGICLHLLACGLVMKPKKNGIEAPLIFKKFCCSFKFHCLCCHHFFAQAIIIYFIFANSYFISKGIDRNQSPFLLSIFGFSNLIGRLIIVLFGYFKPNPMHYLYIFSLTSLIISLLLVFIKVSHSFTQFAVISVFLGILFGMKNSIQANTVLILFDQKDFSTISGFILFIFGCTAFVGPPFAGWIAEETDSVDAPMLVAASFISVGFLFATILVFISRSHVQKKYLHSTKSLEDGLPETETMMTTTAVPHSVNQS